MDSQKDEVSETGEGEDIPSDFFDDFTKDEFMEGLSVVDECWEDVNGSHQQIPPSRYKDELDNVKDLRELIGENNDSDKMKRKNNNKSSYTPNRKESRETDIDSFIKPGSRRDPNKTNEAIKKDKEVKVQQFLAKTLESTHDLRPPGTELDDYYEDENIKANKKDAEKIAGAKEQMKPVRERSHSPQPIQQSPKGGHSPRPRRNSRTRMSPRSRPSPRGSPRHYTRNWSPSKHRTNHVRKFSPGHVRNFRKLGSPPRRRSPRRSPVRRSPGRRSPGRRSPGRRSPVRRSPMRRSPHRFSPSHRSPRRQLRSGSPRRRLPSRRSRTRSRSPRRTDSFLYPNNPETPYGYPHGNPSYQPELEQQYVAPVHQEYPGNAPGFYPQPTAYGGGFSDPYNYGVPQIAQSNMSGPVALPNVNPVPAPPMANPVAVPPMVPPPTSASSKSTPYDALAQLVAEGKISQEDYLKLTPNKGVATTMDTKTRVMVLTRCNQALSKLDKLFLPNRLMANTTVNTEDKYIAPKYCSPLKRQALIEFSFTKGSISPGQQSKQLVESIISTLGLEKVVSKYKKKLPKDMKDAVIQTTKPQCDVCEIRESTKYRDIGTSTDPEYFTSTVHTQVVEQDLVSSKSIFNPSGSVGEGAAISIAHLTPAQLVSQLAARAKTLKQPQEPPPSNQYSRRPPNYDYDYDGRGGQYHSGSYNNYRY